MRACRIAFGALLVGLLFVAEARPEPSWHMFTGPQRTVQLDDTASRDAPVFAYAFGPSGQLSLGHRVDLLVLTCGTERVFGVEASALVALEDASQGAVLPDELMRIVGTLGVAWSFVDTFGSGSAFEVGLGLGIERARELVGAESERVELTPGPRDIPFGAGGLWLGLDLAARFHVSPKLALDLRLADRMFTNAWPLAFGLRAESQSVASYLDEGLSHAPSLALGLRWLLSAEVQPVARAFVEGLVPHDDHARLGVFARLVLGVAWRNPHGEILPFLSLDLGNGKGLLVTRRELRLSIGVRHVFH